jgi:hypothetical protein
VRVALLAFLLVFGFHAAARADEAGMAALKAGGHVAMVRHGLTTPGTGDPLGFKLEDCATQRNLIEEWCRCVETAELMAVGRVEKSSPLNNLFGRPQNRAKQVQEMRELVAGWKGPGNLLLVTHGATIGALMGVNPETAAGVVLAPAPGTAEGFRVVGRLGPDG